MSNEQKKKTIKTPVVIVVEGMDYFRFLLHQLDGPARFAEVQLWNFSETGELGEQLRLLTDVHDFQKVRALGVIRDVEAQRAAQEQSVQSAFRNAGLAVPARQMEVENGTPKTGFLLMPHDEDSGCLEHACVKVMPKPFLDCVEGFYQCMSPHHNPPLNENYKAKLKVHARIAGSNKPQLTLGDSSKAGFWDFTQEPLKVMLDFIEKMVRA